MECEEIAKGVAEWGALRPKQMRLTQRHFDMLDDLTHAYRMRSHSAMMRYLIERAFGGLGQDQKEGGNDE